MSKLQQDKEEHSARAFALVSMIDRLQPGEILYKDGTAQDIYSRVMLDNSTDGIRHIESVLAGDNPDLLSVTVEMMVITGTLIEIVAGMLWCVGGQQKEAQ